MRGWGNRPEMKKAIFRVPYYPPPITCFQLSLAVII